MYCLGHGLNCVFISGIQMTATKVMGFYMESSAKHKFSMRKVSGSIIDIFQVLIRDFKQRERGRRQGRRNL